MKQLKYPFLLLLVSMIGFQSCLFNKEPEACFSASTTDATATFSSSCSADAEAWDWDFGDGSTSILENPSHTYTASGSYTVTLRVTSKKGKTNTTTQSVSATVDPCIGVNCVNGDCVNGSCNCDAGYYGSDCSTAFNSRYNGIYNLTETCNMSGNAAYVITVAPQNGTTMNVSFLGLYEEPQFATIASLSNDGLEFTIPTQVITTMIDRSFSGSGAINTAGTTISISYNFIETSSGNTLETCTGTMTK